MERIVKIKKRLSVFIFLFFFSSCVVIIKQEVVKKKEETKKETKAIFNRPQTFKRTVYAPSVPDDPEILNQLGESANERGNYDKAIKYYKKAIELNPNFISSYHNLGVSYFNKGKHKEAKKYFKEYEIRQNFLLENKKCQTNNKDIEKD